MNEMIRVEDVSMMFNMSSERIDNINETGTAVVNGQEWTARAKQPTEIFEENTIVRVVDVMGVKLIVEKE